MTRRLHVLSEHPQLGKPGDYRDGFPGAQAFVDAGIAEWEVDPTDPVVDLPGEVKRAEAQGDLVQRDDLVETTERVPAVEAAVTRPSRRTRPKP